jgi:hypothetical protein
MSNPNPARGRAENKRPKGHCAVPQLCPSVKSVVETANNRPAAA